MLFNTIGVSEKTFGVFEISFGVLHLSAGKLGVWWHKHRVYPTPFTMTTKSRGIDDDSHGGNVLFPGWECFVPKVGINSSQGGNK